MIEFDSTSLLPLSDTASAGARLTFTFLLLLLFLAPMGTYGTSLGGPAGHGRPARKGLDEACAELCKACLLFHRSLE